MFEVQREPRCDKPIMPCDRYHHLEVYEATHTRPNGTVFYCIHDTPLSNKLPFHKSVDVRRKKYKKTYSYLDMKISYYY